VHQGAHGLLEDVGSQLVKLDCLSAELLVKNEELALFCLPCGLVVREGLGSDA